ncbi:MAG TPA: electron transfer flavoprotein subunit beta/FixA family protein [Rhodothermales bacterium]|nr:electron transfer flavoprotein subunit beta/FixA family protein [Rhodothermales bacterium]
MNFTICIKQVPDVTAPVQIRGGALVFDTGRMVLNAYDASAVEEALVLTDKYGGEVDLVLVGPEKAKETIRKALAMGAARATHIVVDEDAALDSRAYAEMLAAHFEQAEYDIIACGKQSQDTDAGLAGTMLAALLDVPYATNAVGLDLEDDTLIVTRQGDTGQEIIALPTPCLVTCSNDMNDPRIPNIKGIMQSKRKPLETVAGTPPEAMTEVLAYEPMPEREPGPQLDGDPADIARQLVDKLATEAKVL